MKHRIGVVVVMQALVMHAIGGFIVGKVTFGNATVGFMVVYK